MRKKLKNSIAMKQAKTALIAAVLVGFVFSFSQLLHDLAQQHEGTQKNIEHILGSMRDPATKAAYNLSTDLSSKVLNGLFENPQISEGYLYAILGSGQNELLAQKTREKQNENLTGLAEWIFDVQKLYELPLILDDKRTVTGLIQVRLDATYLTQTFLDRAVFVLTAGFARNLILALALIIVFYHTLTKPIAQIAERISKIDIEHPERGLLQTPKSHEQDELGTLTKGINKALKLLGSNLEHRRLAEEQKEESMLMFETLAKISSDIFWKTDKNFQIELISSDQQSIKLESKLRLNGKNLAKLFLDRSTPELTTIIRDIVENPRDFRDIQIKFSEFEKPIILSFFGSAKYDSHGRFEGYLGSAADITASYLQNMAFEETQDKLRQSQKMEAVGQLTGGIAHDFNNLLAVIIGNLEILGEELTDSPHLKKMVESAIKSGEKGAVLTQQLLAFSRKQALHPEVVNLNELITNLSGMLKRTLGGDIEVVTHLDENGCEAFIDSTQFENAIINLCINARDAMPGGGTLTITAENFEINTPQNGVGGMMQPGGYARVSVADTGTGMDKLTLQKSMEPFFTTKDVGKGSGMGLAMVFGFVAQSLGNIQIESDIGEGTCVTLYLPRPTTIDSSSDRRKTENSQFVPGKIANIN